MYFVPVRQFILGVVLPTLTKFYFKQFFLYLNIFLIMKNDSAFKQSLTLPLSYRRNSQKKKQPFSIYNQKKTESGF